MRYDDVDALDEVYHLIASLFERGDQAEQAMTIADALIAVGEDRSWASVWWGYGAIHHDLSGSAYDRALKLLTRVDGSPEARAAAVMLRAEIEATRAIETSSAFDESEQVELLSEAVELAPAWPSLHVRLAHACAATGQQEAAQRHAEIAVKQLDEGAASEDPFDTALSGTNLDRTYITKELRALGLLTT